MQNSAVTLLINGYAHSNWERYSIDSNLLIAADAFEVSLSQNQMALPDYLREGASVLVQIDGHTILNGVVDDIDDGISRTDTSLSIRGRDLAGQLVDCAAPIFASRQVTLDEVVNKIVKSLGISKVRVATTQTKFERVAAEPGESAWDVLQHVAEANGLWPWLEADGTLVVGGADYSTPIAANLYLNRNGTGGNCESIRRVRSMANRYSEVIVLGQSHGTEVEDGENAILGKATDLGVGIYRPHIVIDSESVSRGIALTRARKLLADGRLAGYTLSVVVKGHYTEAGELWAPGQRIQVSCDRLGINAVHYLMGRTFKRDRSVGTITELQLKEDGVWTIDAHPRSKKHPRGRTSDGKIIEILDTTQ